jgi:hypothetical protein
MVSLLLSEDTRMKKIHVTEQKRMEINRILLLSHHFMKQKAFAALNSLTSRPVTK